MATLPDTVETLAELVARLGGVPLERIRVNPLPGSATEQDVLDIADRHNRLCELVDGVLVEKAMGYRESRLALALGRFLQQFVASHNLGLVTGSDGMLRLAPGLVRIPDLAYAAWDRFPDGRVPDEAIPDLAPDLAVEVLSTSNTQAEMDRKRREYFQAGARLVWLVDPGARTVTVFTRGGDTTSLTCTPMLDGQDVLPGFTLSLGELFAERDRRPPDADPAL